MTQTPSNFSRRRWLKGASAILAGGGIGASALPSLALAALGQTPRQPLGPFYPPRKPLDHDNDLTRVDGQSAPAQGKVIHVMGRVLGSGRATDPEVPGWKSGRPTLSAAIIIHATGGTWPLDPGFQGFGQDLADDGGAYRFRTIEPVPYPAGGSWMRPPHIHFSIAGPGFAPLVTQMYFAGSEYNERDSLLRSIRDPAARASLIVDLQPSPADLEPGTRVANFDIVLGRG